MESVMLAATTPSIGGAAFQIASSGETTVGEMAERLVSPLKD